MPYDNFAVVCSGINNLGNFFCKLDFGPNAPNQNCYFYVNKDGSLFFYSPDGSKSYHHADGVIYTPPPKNVGHISM